jgi:hypothetical protein
MKIKEYLDLYLGCRAITTKNTYSNPEFGTLDYYSIVDNEVCISTGNGYYLCSPEEVRPVLRPLTDMKHNEKDELEVFQFENMKLGLNQVERASIVTKWYLDRYFDVFQLIPSGLAIDATTLQ